MQQICSNSKGMQDGALSQIIGSVGINIHHASALNGIDDRTRKLFGYCRTSEAPPQSSSITDNRRISVSSPVHHNGTPAGMVVNPFFQPFQYQGISVFALVSRFGQIKSQRTFQRTVFVRKRSGIVIPAIFPMRNDRRKKQSNTYKRSCVEGFEKSINVSTSRFRPPMR